MSARLDELAPSYIGARRIRIALLDPTEPLRPNRLVALTVSYELAEPEGIALPLEQITTPPDPRQAQRRVFRRFAPTQLGFTPREAGDHLIVLRELFHNRWAGALRIIIPAEDL